MATIPSGQKFHTIPEGVNTQERGSALANSQREIYTMQDIIDTAGGGAEWGDITGTLSNQTDLQSALNAKQAVLVSSTNIKTINGSSVLGSGNLTISGGRSRIVGRRDDQFSSILFLNFGQIADSTVTDIDIQFNAGLGVLIKLYVSTNGGLPGATQIATYTLTADSGRFIRRFFTQIFNEGSYIDLNLRGLNSSYSAISDLPNASNLENTIIGNDSTVFYPYLIATISAGNFESWIVEYGN